ncbi:hypothetical protein B0H17DRAFT_569868 [Mycena rosella]|uniref:Uncharacterized protein n=1 Tax=Mycena rosella TaxID=1033263 RepID=A0AAD7M9N6_MYCRO|nr:hypothetical protein B0H17DRAFT_569868 [Mycena rosella]
MHRECARSSTHEDLFEMAKARTLSSAFMAGHGRFPVFGVPYIAKGANGYEYTRLVGREVFAQTSELPPTTAPLDPLLHPPFPRVKRLVLVLRATLAIFTDAQTLHTQFRWLLEDRSRATPFLPSPPTFGPRGRRSWPSRRRSSPPVGTAAGLLAAVVADRHTLELWRPSRMRVTLKRTRQAPRDDAAHPQEEERADGAGAPLLGSCDERVGGGVVPASLFTGGATRDAAEGTYTVTALTLAHSSTL